MKPNSKGFTIPELIVVMLLSAFFSSLVLYFTFNYWGYAFSLQADQETLTDRLNAGDIIRESIGTSSGLIIQNGLADNYPLAPDPNNSQYYWLPIHAIPGTKNIPSSGLITPLTYYRRYSVNSSGAYIMNGTNPYEDEYVLYLDGSSKSLKLRTLANSNAMGDKLKTSCPTINSTVSCPADKTIVSNLASVGVRYFSRTGNLIDYTSIVDPNTQAYIGPDFPVVEVVEYTLNISEKTTFQKTAGTSSSTIIRIALRNT